MNNCHQLITHRCIFLAAPVYHLPPLQNGTPTLLIRRNDLSIVPINYTNQTKIQKLWNYVSLIKNITNDLLHYRRVKGGIL